MDESVVTDRFASLAATVFSSPHLHTTRYYLTAFNLTRENNRMTERSRDRGKGRRKSEKKIED